MQGKKKAICTTGFIIVNIGIFLGIMLIGKDGDTMFLLEHGAMYAPYVLEGKVLSSGDQYVSAFWDAAFIK